MSTRLTGNKVNGHLRCPFVMCVGFIIFMIFGVFLSAGCSTKADTLTGGSETPDTPGALDLDLVCPTGTARLAGSSTKTIDTCIPLPLPDLDCGLGEARFPNASKKTLETCISDIDTDRDGILDFLDTDDDGDGHLDEVDVDDNGDGLIEIHNLTMLHNIRYNRMGTGYKTGTGDGDGDKTGCGVAKDDVCSGYELTQNLSFDKDNDGTWSGDGTSGYTLDAKDSASPYFMVDGNGNGGWVPIGDSDSTSFNAIFDGKGYTITDLAISGSGSHIGMFGVIGAGAVIRNIGLVDGLAHCTGTGFAFVGSLVGEQTGGSIINSYATGWSVNRGSRTGNVGGLVGEQTGGSIINSEATTVSVNGGTSGTGADNVGGLVGESSGIITRSRATDATHATGLVDGGAGGNRVGGLVGEQTGGSIMNSEAMVDVDGGAGGNRVGGLVGKQSAGSIMNSEATGIVNGGAGDDFIGGLVGEIFGSIMNSEATGIVNGGSGDDRVGGLVGESSGIITDSEAIGGVNGGAGADFVGGLVGQQMAGSITDSHAASDVNGKEGEDYVGGLVGRQANGDIAASYATGSVYGGNDEEDESDRVGGLVGEQANGSIIASYATGNVNGGDDNKDDCFDPMICDNSGDLVGGFVGKQVDGSIIASYATGDSHGGGLDPNGRTEGNNSPADEVGGFVGSQADGSITASYSIGDVNEGASDDQIGVFVGVQAAGGSITASYGFGPTRERGNPAAINPLGAPTDANDNAITEDGLMSSTRITDPTDGANTISIGDIWNAASSKTLGAWDFGTASQIPALQYADYDGTAGTVYYCDNVVSVPSTGIPIPNCPSDPDDDFIIIPDQVRQ